MARKPRLHVPGGVYHTLLRGNGGEDIFFTKEDRFHFYHLLEEGSQRYAYRIHGFCLMRNHVHLAIQISEVSLSKIMHNISFRYTRWVNKRKRRIGHLFQGRYKALLVDAESYLLELVRYIHLNPVRAGLVKDPADYPWSSHAAFLGLETIPWLTTEWVLGQFGKRMSTAQKHFKSFVVAELDEGHREEFHRGGDDSRLLGDDSFIEHVLAQGPTRRLTISLDHVIKVVCKRYNIEQKDLAGPSRIRSLSEARGVVSFLCRQTGAASQTEVARRFKRDIATLSRITSRIEGKAKASRDFAEKLDSYINTITQA